MPTLRVIRGKECAEIPFEGAPKLSSILNANGYGITHPCGGRGICGKCTVMLSGDVSPMNVLEMRAGKRLSCQAVLTGNCEVVLPEQQTMTQIEGANTDIKAASSSHEALEAAVDIGTTTIVLKLFETAAQRELSSAAMINPQTAIAADVMGRIGAAMSGSAELLQCEAAETIERLLDEACAKSGCRVDEVRRLVITGNTAMLCLLTARDPSALSHAPFEAEFLFGNTETVVGREAYLPPCMNAFVGADITCAVLASGMCGRKETSLLCDIGTNGEIALWKAGTLYVTSTAAGPAFEGTGIVNGCGSVRGAIDKVWIESGKLMAHTIEDETAVGICGSGLIDAVSVLLRLEYIDETGAMEEAVELKDGIALYPQDVRNVQLAKAAIAAGMQTLMKQAGAEKSDIKRLYIAGGFGNHLNMKSAAAIGLIPSAFIASAISIGNAALSGAKELLLNPEKRQCAEQLAASAKHIVLGGNPEFNSAYIESMVFPCGMEKAFI